MDIINLFLVLGALFILALCAAWIAGMCWAAVKLFAFVLITLWEALCDTL